MTAAVARTIEERRDQRMRGIGWAVVVGGLLLAGCAGATIDNPQMQSFANWECTSNGGWIDPTGTCVVEGPK
jgi:hypothetical protein